MKISFAQPKAKQPWSGRIIHQSFIHRLVCARNEAHGQSDFVSVSLCIPTPSRIVVILVDLRLLLFVSFLLLSSVRALSCVCVFLMYLRVLTVHVQQPRCIGSFQTRSVCGCECVRVVFAVGLLYSYIQMNII